MSILDEYGINEARQQAPAETQTTEAQETVQENTESETVVENQAPQEQSQETTQPAQEQTTTNHNTVETTQEKPVSQFANEEIAQMNSYLTKYPEKTIDDYKALTAPIESLNEEDLLRSYLSEKEGKTKSQVEYALKNLELKESDPDFDDEFENGDSDLENLKKKGEREALLEQAKLWREEFVKSELSFDEESTATQEQQVQEVPSIEKFIEDAKVQHQAYKEKYTTKIYEALPQLDKIDLNIQGKIVSYIPDENFKTEMRKGAEDVSQIGIEYFDETGMIKDPKGFIENNTLWANPKTRQPMIDFMIKQAIDNHIAETDKKRRNITLDDASGKVTPQSSDRGAVVDKLFNGRSGW